VLEIESGIGVFRAGTGMLNQGLLPLGSLFAGALADVWSAPLAVMVMGSSVLALAGVACMMLPSMRKL
jgi:hypothetical protein